MSSSGVFSGCGRRFVNLLAFQCPAAAGLPLRTPTDELKKLWKSAQVTVVDGLTTSRGHPALGQLSERRSARCVEKPSVHEIGLGPSDTIVEEPLRAARDEQGEVIIGELEACRYFLDGISKNVLLAVSGKFQEWSHEGLVTGNWHDEGILADCGAFRRRRCHPTGQLRCRYSLSRVVKLAVEVMDARLN